MQILFKYRSRFALYNVQSISFNHIICLLDHISYAPCLHLPLCARLYTYVHLKSTPIGVVVSHSFSLRDIDRSILVKDKMCSTIIKRTFFKLIDTSACTFLKFTDTYFLHIIDCIRRGDEFVWESWCSRGNGAWKDLPLIWKKDLDGVVKLVSLFCSLAPISTPFKLTMFVHNSI